MMTGASQSMPDQRFKASLDQKSITQKPDLRLDQVLLRALKNEQTTFVTSKRSVQNNEEQGATGKEAATSPTLHPK